MNKENIALIIGVEMYTPMDINYLFKQEKKYYNPIFFFILSPIFSFILPMILYGINIYQTGNKNKAIKHILLSIVLSLVLFILLMVLSGSFEKYQPKFISSIFLGINCAIGYFLYSKQRNEYKNWKQYNTKSKNILLPILLASLPICILVYLKFSNPFLSNPVYVEEKNNIAYTKTINVDEVKELINEFRDIRLITDESEVALYLKNNKNRYELYFPVNDDYQNTENLNKFIELIETILNESKLFEKHIVIIQVDKDFKVFK